MCMRGRFNITLSQALDEQLDQYAKEHDMTRSAIIESALKEFFKGAQNTQDAHIGLVINEMLHLAQRMKVVEETLAQILHTPQDEYDTNMDARSTSPTINDNADTSSIIDHEKWHRHYEVVQMMPASININTRKSMVSKAVSRGELVTNGKRGNACLIQDSSAVKWLNHIIAKSIQNCNEK